MHSKGSALACSAPKVRIRGENALYGLATLLKVPTECSPERLLEVPVNVLHCAHTALPT
jgi:hypothetical protein